MGGRTVSEQNQEKQALIDEIHGSIDLGFSDYYEDQNVRDSTLDAHAVELHRAVELLTLEEAINYSLFQSFGDAHPSAEVYILDFPSDLRAAFYLLLGGYYRPAILSLRNWFEMRLLGIYFARIETDPQKYQQWKLDAFQAPIGGRLIGQLLTKQEFKMADGKLNLRQRLSSLYSELSAFTHGAGLQKHSLQADTDNVPRYNRASVALWLKLFEQTFGEVVVCLYLAYGRATFAYAGAKETEAVLGNLPAPYSAMLRSGLAGNLTAP
jgi:hypothetical protein